MFLGIDLGGTNIKLGLFDSNLSLIANSRTETESEKGSSVVVKNLFKGIESILQENNVASHQLQAIGIGVPGLIDIENGISLFSPNFADWENVPLAALIENKTHVPVFIDNDVRMNLYGEWLKGIGKNKENIVLITLGTGLGAGVVMGGNVLYGKTSSAAEIGHMNMVRNGRPCACGSSGCFGRYVSARGMVATAKEKIQAGTDTILLGWTRGNTDLITAKMISDAYDAEDKLAREVLQETGEMFGFGLVNVINLYNPELIIIGGGMAKAGERLLQPARKIVKQRALKISSAACEIVYAELGDSAGIVGAAAVAQKKMVQ